MSSILAVLFDFGGVLAEEGFSNGLEALAVEQGLDTTDMTEQGMRAVYDSGYVLGEGSESEFWALLRRRTGLQGTDKDLKARMFEGFVMRPWMIECVKQLRSQGYLVGILSDQTDWLDELDGKLHFYRYFDRVYNSYYLGKGKCDQTHFDAIATDMGINAGDILFVDDSADNVDRAKNAGMQAILYVDRDRFLQSLKQALASQN